MTVRNYRDLVVWQTGIRLCTAIYRLTRAFPSHERFALASQLQRASVSIPSNIAEGHAYGSDRVFARHLRIAAGSAVEVDTQLLIAEQLGYLSEEQGLKLRLETETLIRQIRALGKRIDSDKPS